MAAQLSSDAGVDYRYGPSAASYGVGNTGMPTLFARDTATQLGSPAPAYSYFWQIGGPPSATGGAYSSSWGQMLFTPDNPTQYAGVTDVQATAYMYNTFAQLPQLSWTRGGATASFDTFNVMGYKAQNIVASGPVATGRCEGRPGFCSTSVVAFQNGVIGTVGSNTASNATTVKLPANKVPTAIAMTNDSEFALVTVWDTTALKGQIAVVALAGLCDGCSPYYPNGGGTNPVSGSAYPAYYDNWHEWMAPYPGLPNMGDIAFMKILGYVDLPGITAPTEISVTTGLDPFRTIMSGGNFIGLANSPLSSNWQNFTSSGSLSGSYAKGGMAVVISKSEQKAAFIDLKPLFSYLNGIYFSANTTQANNLGQADNQWPYTFTQVPAQMPTVVKTISLGAKPTAVKATPMGSLQRAWIATQDGTLHIYSLDGYAPGGTAASPTPSAIAEVGTVTGVGRNPTSLAISKNEPDTSLDAPAQQILVTSRGDRKVSWVRLAADGNGGSIVRTLQDTRIVDPIASEDADSFANTGNVMSVVDYTAKSVRNYRYGPVMFSDGGACPAPNGCPVTPTGSIGIEYGGAMVVPGKPFQLTTSNTP